MDWVLLLLLLPAIVVPIVLLFGFAGCQFEHGQLSSSDIKYAKAFAIDERTIQILWLYEGSDPATSFEIVRAREGWGGIFPEKILTAPGTTDRVDDGPFPEGTTYYYRVRGIVSGSDPTAFKPLPPNWLSARTPSFEKAFESTPSASVAGLNLSNYCVVQRIEPARLYKSGYLVRITLRGFADQPLTLDKISISRPAASGDPYDSDPTTLRTVALSVTVPANSFHVLPVFGYYLDHTKPLLIAFDVNATAGSGSGWVETPVPDTEAVVYLRPDTQEAEVADRVGPLPAYTVGDSVYFLHRIDVATLT